MMILLWNCTSRATSLYQNFLLTPQGLRTEAQIVKIVKIATSQGSEKKVQKKVLKKKFNCTNLYLTTVGMCGKKFRIINCGK